MEKIKVLIVEDKSLVAEGIATLLRKNSLDVVAPCDSGEEAIEVAAAQQPDLILMDIELSGALDGIATAAIIQKQNPIPIIYLSDFKDAKTVDRAKKTLPANYLTKPFNELDLIRAIDIAFTNASAQPVRPAMNKEYVFVRTDTQVFVKVKLAEIVYLEAGRSYSKIYTESAIHTLSTSLNHVHEQIAHPSFVRIHRSIVVNLDKVEKLDGNMILLSNGKSAQMSKEYKDVFMEQQKVIK